MTDDFENNLSQAWRGMGEWNPPPLSARMRERLVNLPRARATPSFGIVWRLADSAANAAKALVEVIEAAGAALAAPAPAALLRGDKSGPTAQVIECSLGGATLKVAISPDSQTGDELRLAVSLEGAGEGNFNIELLDGDADDILESRPLRQTTSMALRDGGVYCLAVMKNSEEIGRVRFTLDKQSPGGSAEKPC